MGKKLNNSDKATVRLLLALIQRNLQNVRNGKDMKRVIASIDEAMRLVMLCKQFFR